MPCKRNKKVSTVVSSRRISAISRYVISLWTGLPLSEEERMDIVKLEGLFDLLAPAVVLVKRRVLALNNSISFSEFHYMYPYIVSMMWRLFEPTMMVQHHIPSMFLSVYCIRLIVLLCR